MKPVTPARWRVFAALELSPAWQQYLTGLIDSLKGELGSGGLRWVKPDGIHLTLKFYGEVRPDVVPALEETLRRAGAGSAPVPLDLGGLGVFPGPRAPRVMWVGLAGDLPALAALAQAVETGAAPLGFPPEARGFSPHLTLARVSGRLSTAESRKLQEVVARPPAGGAGPQTFTDLSLMRSELRGPGGAKYTQLMTAPLAGRAP